MNQDKMETPAKPSRWTLPGWGLLQGLAVSGMNMVQSFYNKERMTTVQYPEERAPISPNCMPTALAVSAEVTGHSCSTERPTRSMTAR